MENKSKLYHMRYYLAILGTIFFVYLYSIYTGWSVLSPSKTEKYSQSGASVHHK